jgi:hypothetical protein
MSTTSQLSIFYIWNSLGQAKGVLTKQGNQAQKFKRPNESKIYIIFLIKYICYSKLFCHLSSSFKKAKNLTSKAQLQGIHETQKQRNYYLHRL